VPAGEVLAVRGAVVSGPLLTARQVADLLGVSAETVLRWTRRGELPAIRLPGGAIRLREDELDGWLEQRATPTRSLPTTTPSAARQGTLQSVAPTTTEDEED
jgi:excisionase family DNA binding protein